MKYLALILAVFVMIGCGLTPEQSAALKAYELQLEQLHREAGEFADELSYYDDEIAAVVAKIKSKQIPVSEGMALINQFMERKTETLKAYSEIREQIDATWQAKNDLEASGVPWWSIALHTLEGILVAAGLAKWRGALRIVNAVIDGVETGGCKDTKIAIEEAAIAAKVSTQLKGIVLARTPTVSKVADPVKTVA